MVSASLPVRPTPTMTAFQRPKPHPLRFLNPLFYIRSLLGLLLRPAWQRKYKRFRK